MGWTPGSRVDGHLLSFAVVRLESAFDAEVLEGEVLLVRTSITNIGRSLATFRNLILRENGETVFRLDWISVLMNLDARKSASIPDRLHKALEDYQRD